jgi:hypothetical protein
VGGGGGVGQQAAQSEKVVIQEKYWRVRGEQGPELYSELDKEDMSEAIKLCSVRP